MGLRGRDDRLIVEQAVVRHHVRQCARTAIPTMIGSRVGSFNSGSGRWGSGPRLHSPSSTIR
eukprot:3688408-Heterocapsa_arctica.AAC.1